VVTWEFPVLAKYRFSLPLVKPFKPVRLFEALET
jgi:hypothetical protein